MNTFFVAGCPERRLDAVKAALDAASALYVSTEIGAASGILIDRETIEAALRTLDARVVSQTVLEGDFSGTVRLELSFDGFVAPTFSEVETGRTEARAAAEDVREFQVQDGTTVRLKVSREACAPAGVFPGDVVEYDNDWRSVVRGVHEETGVIYFDDMDNEGRVSFGNSACRSSADLVDVDNDINVVIRAADSPEERKTYVGGWVLRVSREAMEPTGLLVGDVLRDGDVNYTVCGIDEDGDLFVRSSADIMPDRADYNTLDELVASYGWRLVSREGAEMPAPRARTEILVSEGAGGRMITLDTSPEAGQELGWHAGDIIMIPIRGEVEIAGFKDGIVYRKCGDHAHALTERRYDSRWFKAEGYYLIRSVAEASEKEYICCPSKNKIILQVSRAACAPTGLFPGDVVKIDDRASTTFRGVNDGYLYFDCHQCRSGEVHQYMDTRNLADIEARGWRVIARADRIPAEGPITAEAQTMTETVEFKDGSRITITTGEAVKRCTGFSAGSVIFLPNGARARVRGVDRQYRLIYEYLEGPIAGKISRWSERQRSPAEYRNDGFNLLWAAGAEALEAEGRRKYLNDNGNIIELDISAETAQDYGLFPGDVLLPEAEDNVFVAGVGVEDRALYRKMSTGRVKAYINREEAQGISRGRHFIKVAYRAEELKRPEERTIMTFLNGKNSQSFAEVLEGELSPVVNRDLVVSIPHGNAAPVFDDGFFHILFWSSPEDNRSGNSGDPPSIMWGHEVSCRDSAFKPSGLGKVIMTEEGFPAAELVGNCLYIHHDLPHTGNDSEINIFEMIITEAARLLADSEEELLKNKEQSQERRKQARQKRFVRFCLRYANRDKDNAVRELAETRKRIEEEQKRLVDLRRAAKSAEERIAFFSSSSEARRKRFIDIFESLLRIEGVKRVEMAGSLFKVYTEHIYITPEDGKNETFDIGEFLIEVYLDGKKGGVRFFNQTRVNRTGGYNSHHPHVMLDGTPCLGNLVEMVPQLIAEYEFGILIQSLLLWLRSVNLSDSAGTQIAKYWPKVQVIKEQAKTA